MAHRTSLNSKEILLPFFKRTSFSQLEITCDHMPKWFEKELPALKLRADAKLVDKTLKIYVYPKLNLG
jgi:hypothetical protein